MHEYSTHTILYLHAFEFISATCVNSCYVRRCMQGNTSLHYAMFNGRFDIVRRLLETGSCDVGRQNRNGCTAIMLASLVPLNTADDRRVIEKLMQLGDVSQRTALVCIMCDSQSVDDSGGHQRSVLSIRVVVEV